MVDSVLDQWNNAYLALCHMLTILLTTVLSLLSVELDWNALTTSASVYTVPLMQQPKPRRPNRSTQEKPAPDTTDTKKGRPNRPASVDSLRRGGATRVDTVRV